MFCCFELSGIDQIVRSFGDLERDKENKDGADELSKEDVSVAWKCSEHDGQHLIVILFTGNQVIPIYGVGNRNFLKNRS